MASAIQEQQFRGSVGVPATADERAALLGAVYEHALAHYARTDADPFPEPADEAQLHAALGGALPREGADPRAALATLMTAGEAGVLASHSGRFFGFVMGGAHPVSVAADWLTSVWDQCGALYSTSPVAAVAEEIVVSWLVELFGLPAGTTAGITSGCASANLTGLAAARHHVFAERGWDVGERGLVGAPVPRVLVSEGCHVTVTRALSLLGLGGQVARLATDGQGRLRLDALDAALAAGDGPLIVCAQVGTVDTGAVDPLPEIAARVRAHRGWLHLDAAFGMWAAAGPRTAARVRGLASADSWATDAHKWLNVPYDCGLAFVAHPEAHRAALRTQAAYLAHGGAEHRDPLDYSPEMSRRARSLVLWATLRHLGRDGVAQLVERCCRLAGRLAGRLGAEPGVRVGNDVVLNQVLLLFDSPDDAAGHVGRVVTELRRGGVAWASATTWRGTPALRLSVCNWQTDDRIADACADAVIAAHRSATRAGHRSRAGEEPR
ncbi:pyridoxal phosphate-dependent decarboxylase family protein [Amycolatopsis sp. NPDC005003]